MDKEEYFRQLYSLNDDDSDEEQDTNDAREVIKQSAQPRSTSFPGPLKSSSAKRSQPSKAQKKPVIHRITSAPVSSTSVIRETPLLKLKPSRLRYDVSTPETNHSFSTPTSTSTSPKPAQHSVSPPSINPLVIKNSNGVNSMLKRKRNEQPIKLVPESNRIFAGKTLFFVSPDDKHPVRKLRITNARRYGAVWTKEWTPVITHIVVDKGLKLENVMDLLKPLMKADTIPANIILVNDEYPIDCIQHGTLVDETQGRYRVEPVKPVLEGPAQMDPQPVKPHCALQIQEHKTKKDQDTQQSLAQRSESSSQPPRNQEHATSSPGVWLHAADRDYTSLLENPRERSPILDIVLGEGSELDEMIETARKLENLPLDNDDEEERPSSSDADMDYDHSGSSEEERRFRDHKKRKNKKKGGLNLEGFSCMTGGIGFTNENNPNRETISILERMDEYYTRINDPWRPQAYRRAIATLRRQPAKITNYDDAIELTNIGKRIAAKIEEIVMTGRLRRLEYAELEPVDHVAQLFLKIYDVGTREAAKFIQAGYKTLDDLRTKARLTRNQRIGLEHYDDFNTRIPRDQVTALGDIVKETAKLMDPDVECIIGGSYRRGAATSGDIDFIITQPGTTRSQDLLPFLNSLIDHLTHTSFLKAALATPSHRAGSGSKWHGACVLPDNSTWRRIDFLLVPETEIGAALIYFTGDDLFNRSIRLLASKKNYRLNQRGLYKDVMRSPGGIKVTDGELVEGSDERRIFEILQVPWRKPEHRICH